MNNQNQDFRLPLLAETQSENYISVHNEIPGETELGGNFINSRSSFVSISSSKEDSQSEKSMKSMKSGQEFYGWVSTTQNAYKMDRLQEIKNYKYLQNRPQRKVVVELNLTNILLREMKENFRVLQLLLFSGFLDILIRLNWWIYLIIFWKQNERKPVGQMALVFIIIPRIFNLIAQIKLMFIKLHKRRNNSILPIAILYQQNFSLEDLEKESQLEWYNWTKSLITKFSQPLRIAIFYLLPCELSIISLRMEIKEFYQQNAAFTYVIGEFILNTIETICFTPFIFIILTLNSSNILNTNFQTYYDTITWTLTCFSLGKYCFISLVFLTKRNYQLNFLRIEK